MSKSRFLTLAALALGLFGLSGAPASAFPSPPPAPAAATLLTEVGSRGFGLEGLNPRAGIDSYRGYRGYNGYRGYDGYRRHYAYPRRYYGVSPYWRRGCYGWNSYNCRGFYGGPFIGFGTGIVVVPRRYGYGYGNRHVRWCQNRYRSYSVRTNTWVAYSGRVRECVSPYSR
jgi:hypothetical protein